MHELTGSTACLSYQNQPKSLLSALLIALLMLMLFCCNASACRGPFPEAIPFEEAVAQADAIFLGTVRAITPGFPDDFKPGDEKEYQERLANVEGQSAKNLGHVITFEPITQWKPAGAAPDPVKLVEIYRQHSCEWNYDIKEGDRFIVFASRYGNYLMLPRKMFDGRSHFTLLDPSSRSYSDSDKANYAEQIKTDQQYFDEVARQLKQWKP